MILSRVHHLRSFMLVRHGGLTLAEKEKKQGSGLGLHSYRILAVTFLHDKPSNR